MRRSLRIGFACLATFAAAFGASGSGAQSGGTFSMSILVEGAPVPEYCARGRVYIEALKGKEFTIRLSNPTSERVAVALSVDGRNVVDARRTTELAAIKWVLAPGQTADIPGWQVSGETARKFFFTEASKGYAAWLGDTANVGTIEAVFFREKRREPKPLAKDACRSGARAETMEADAAPVAPSSPAAAKAREADNYASTGIGERTSFPVQWVAFEEDPAPAARVAIRYEFRPELVRLGVLPRQDEELFARDGARGFEHAYSPEPDRPR